MGSPGRIWHRPPRPSRIVGDPHADRFYRAAGAIQIGERESESIPGRMLPLYDLAL